MNDLVTIAEIGRPHGLAGELKVRPIVDASDRFSKLKHVVVEAADGRRAQFTIRRGSKEVNSVLHLPSPGVLLEVRRRKIAPEDAQAETLEI